MKKILSWYLMMGIVLTPVSFAQALGLPAADTTAPTISNITVSSVTPVGAVIAWTTDEVADTQVEYGLTTGYGLSTSLNVTLGTAHLQTLTDLQSGSVYHYRVTSKDAAGNITVSADQTFTTEAAVTVSSSSSSSPSSLSVDVSSTVSTQTDIILDPITTADGPVSNQPDPVLIADPDAYGPVISNVTISSITTVGAIIAWTTDEIADSQIEYALTDVYGFETTLDATFATAHLQTLTNLQPGTTYHFRVKSKDAAGNVTISEDHIFTTVSASIVVDTPPVILTQGIASVLHSSAIILWTTDEIANSQVEYGLTMDYGSHTTLDASLALEHLVTLDDLQPGMTYHYRIKTTSSAGQTTHGGDDTFTTESLTLTVEPQADIAVPLSIANIEASALTSSSALLVWTTSTLADSQVEYGLTTQYGSHTTIDVSIGLAHAVLLDGLHPSTTYHYRVKSTDAEGNIVLSDDQILTTLAVPPAIVTSTSPPTIDEVSVIDVESSTATIAWITDKLANSQVEYGLTNSYGSATTLDASLGLIHSVIINNLEADSTYHYRIKTTDASGHTTLSGDQTFTTASVTVTIEPSSDSPSIVSMPLTVAEVQATALTASSALLSWTTSIPADAQVEYGLTTQYGSHTTIDASLGSVHTVLLRHLSPETTYHYRIKSRDAEGNLVTSDDQTFTTLATPPASVSLSSPPTISAVLVSTESSTATIAWTTNKLANSQVEYGLTDIYGSESALNAAFASAHTVTLTDLVPDTTYHYRIKTTDGGGRVTLSDDETFTTAAVSGGVSSATLPSLGEVETSALTASSALIVWTTSAPTNAQVEYGLTTSYGSRSTLDESLGLAHTTLLIGLQPDTTYHYRIRGADASGNVVIGGDETFTTLEPPTDQTAPHIEEVTVTRTGTANATITWTTDDASTTRVQYGETTAYGVYTDLDATPRTSHSATITGLFPDTTYNFNVQSQDSAGNTAISINHTFHTQTAPYTSGTMSVPVVSHVTDTSVTLSWNVPFDDTAGLEFYDIRYSTEPITQFNFEDATPAREGVEHIVHVQENGQDTEHIYMIIELQPGTPYYFGIKSGASRSTLAHLEETQADLSAETQGGGEVETTAGNTTHNENAVSGRTQATTVGGGSRTEGRGNATGTQGIVGKSGGSRRMPAPRSMQAKAADGEVAFVWTSPLNSPFIHTDIVRKEGSFPASPADGQTVYEGRDETFTDTNLQNGKKYHYAIFTHDDGDTHRGYSKPVLVAMLPTDGIEQFDFRESSSIVSTLPTVGGELKFGMRSAEVSELQKLLTKDRSIYPEGLVSGYFGPLTQAAVKRLQAQHGLSQTGIADRQTQLLLNSATSQATPVSTSSLNTGDLLPGAQGADVKGLQEFLKAEGVFPEGLITGFYGKFTYEAVLRFQKKYDLRPYTGFVNGKTKEKLQELMGQ